MLEFEPVSHTYTLDGKRLPSVTQVLQIVGGYEGIPERVMEAARERGDAVHLATEFHDRGVLDAASIPAEIIGYFDAYLRFMDESQFVVTDIEQRVWSAKRGFAGTADRFGTMSKTSCVLDIKCTAQHMPAAALQTAAYQFAALESFGIVAKARFSLLLKPDGHYSLKEHTDPSDLSVFLSCLQVHIWKARNT